MKKQIRLTLETLDLSKVDDTLLVVKLSAGYRHEDLIAVQDVFYQILKDMGKQLRVAFVPEGTQICKACPREEMFLKNAITDEKELIEGKNDDKIR